MNKKEFEQLMEGTKVGKVGHGQKSVEAARLHFVTGIQNIAECARIAGVSPQAARVTVNWFHERIKDSGLDPVTVMVPKGKKKAIEKFAAELRQTGKKT